MISYKEWKSKNKVEDVLAGEEDQERDHHHSREYTTIHVYVNPLTIAN